MSDDWKPGDVAVCVDASMYVSGRGRRPELSEGARYTVCAVLPTYAPPIGQLIHPKATGIALVLLEVRHPINFYGAYDAFRFIKQPSLVTEEGTFSAAPIEKEGV